MVHLYSKCRKNKGNDDADEDGDTDDVGDEDGDGTVDELMWKSIALGEIWQKIYFAEYAAKDLYFRLVTISWTVSNKALLIKPWNANFFLIWVQRSVL